MEKNLISKKIAGLINDLKNTKNRKELNLTFSEGINILESSIENNVDIKYLVIDKNKIEQFSQFFEKIDNSRIYLADEQIIKKLSSTKTSYSCITVFSIPDIIEEVKDIKLFNNIFDYLKIKSYITGLFQISDPGNLGTIIRSSIGFNQDELIIFAPFCDIFSPKVIRSTSGAIFNLKKVYTIYADSYQLFFENIKKFDVKIVISEKDKTLNKQMDKNDFPSIIIFGNEGRGFTSDFKKFCDFSLSIPQSDKIDSLNLSVSHGIVLYILNKLICEK